MPKVDKAVRRDKRRFDRRHNRPTSRAFLHTLDRLAAQRDRKKVARA